MPHVPKEEGDRSLAQELELIVKDISLSTVPVVITGVNRKVNIGNFETIDVYGAVAIPVNTVIDEKLNEIIHELMTIGYASVSKEVSSRYKFIKDAVGSGEETS